MLVCQQSEGLPRQSFFVRNFKGHTSYRSRHGLGNLSYFLQCCTKCSMRAMASEILVTEVA